MDNFERYKKDFSKIPLLTSEETEELALRMKNGDKKAKKKLIESNLKLVVSIAAKQKYSPFSNSINDLIQVGNQWLIQHVEDFNPSKGKFSTFASEGIHYSMINYLEKDKPIRIPVNTQKEINKIIKADEELFKKLERNPATYELAKATKIKEKRISELSMLKTKKVPLDEHEEPTFMEVLEELHEEIILNRKNAVKILVSLTQQERKVIELKFGMSGDDPKNLSEIGTELGVSKVRVHAIQENLTKKIIKLLEEGKKEEENPAN